MGRIPLGDDPIELRSGDQPFRVREIDPDVQPFEPFIGPVPDGFVNPSPIDPEDLPEFLRPLRGFSVEPLDPEGPSPFLLGSEFRLAQSPISLPTPLTITSVFGPSDFDHAGLQFFRVDEEQWTPVPTTVDYAAGTVSVTVDRFGDYALFLGVVHDIPLPAGTAALGFHGAPGTALDLLQGQLADPAALQAIFQFVDGAWLSFRPGGLAILNSLTSIDAHAPLYLVLSRATTWAGPINAPPARDVAIADGFTALTYTGAPDLSADAFIALFADPDRVGALFGFDNALITDRGGYRIFRLGAPTFLNDLDSLAPFDVLFVLADGATSLALPTP